MKVDSVLLNNKEEGDEVFIQPKLKIRKPYELVKLWVLREYLKYEFREESFLGVGCCFFFFVLKEINVLIIIGQIAVCL